VATSILGPSRKKGFTLLEVLVVLILVSMAATLLIQGIGVVLNLRYRAVSFIDQQQHGQLRSAWITQLLNGLVPEQPDGDHLFKGGPTRLEGLSIQSLNAESGLPRHITLELEYQGTNVVLSYRQDDIHWPLGQWPMSGAAFTYLDPEGNWHDQWPPKGFAESKQLPVAVEIQVGDAWSLFSVVQGRKSAKIPIYKALL